MGADNKKESEAKEDKRRTSREKEVSVRGEGTAEVNQENEKNKKMNSQAYATTHIFTVPAQGTSEITYPPEFHNLTKKEQKLLKDLFAELRNGTHYPIIKGGFGDMENCDGIVEKRIPLSKGGLVIKLWGCDYLFKGFPAKEVVEGLGLAKAMLSSLPRNILLRSWFWIFVLGIRYVFFRRGLIHDLHVLFNTVFAHTVVRFGIHHSGYKEYNVVGRELKRAGDEALKKMLDIRASKKDYQPSQVYFKTLLWGNYLDHAKPREMWELIASILELFYLFVESDNAYRFRLQDVLMELDKEAVKKNVIKEVVRLIDILIERENPGRSEGLQLRKWKAVKKVVVPALLLNKKLRMFLKEYLLQLNLDVLKFDVHDEYYILRRDTYRFKGIHEKERMKEADRIDREKEIVKLSLIQIKDGTGRTFPAVKLIRAEPEK